MKWFDSNYHYVKPTFEDGQEFKLSSHPKPVAEFLEVRNFSFLVQRRPGSKDTFSEFLTRKTRFNAPALIFKRNY